MIRATVLPEGELRTLLIEQGYIHKVKANDPGMFTLMHTSETHYLTRTFWDSMYLVCGKEIGLVRFPPGIAEGFSLHNQFLSESPGYIKGFAWHKDWFIPNSFKED